MMLRIATILLLFGAVPAAAQELDLSVSADSVTVGQRFLLSLTARHDFAAAAAFPATDSGAVFGDLEVLGVRARDSFARDGGRVDSIVYEVTTFALDTARIAPISIVFTAAEDTFTVETDASWLPVISLVPPDAEDVRDLAPLVEFPAPRWPYAVAACIFLLLALIVFLLLRRRRRARERDAPPPPPIPPDQEALERLDHLERVDLSARSNVQPFYDELSGVLRTYAARRLGVRAMEQTTGELIREMMRQDRPASDAIERIRTVLTASDLVKFADASPAAGDGKHLVQMSRTIVQDVEEQLRPPEPETPSDAVQ